MSDFPTAQDSELALVGVCLLCGLDAAELALRLVPLDHLFRDDVRQSMGVIEGMVSKGKTVDAVSFAQAWKESLGGLPGVEIMASPEKVGPSDPKYYAEEINRAARRRQIIMATQKAQLRAKDERENPEQVATDLEAELSARVDHGIEISAPIPALKSFLGDMERRYELQGKRSGLCTGFSRLDAMTDGLQFGELAVIGARPSIGKTAIMCNMVELVCLTNHIPTLIFTYEMSPVALMRRLFCGMCQVPMGEIRAGRLTEISFSKLTQFQSIYRDAPIHIVNALSGVNITRLCSVIRQYVRKHGVQFVTVDYLQKIPPAEKHEKRTYEIGATSGQLKAVAEQTNISLLVAAQLSREPDKDKGRRPRLSDLADSSQIERDSDLVILLHRDKSDPEHNAELIVAKQRDGEVGVVHVNFNPAFMKFENKL